MTLPDGTTRPCSDLYDLSRPLRAGETIDFFMSHSWKDDPVAKHAALEEIASDFHRKNGRHPTFWLDKVPPMLLLAAPRICAVTHMLSLPPA